MALTPRPGVSGAVVLRSNGSASTSPHHFWVHRKRWRYQNRSGNQRRQNVPRCEATSPAFSAHIPHRDSERETASGHHDVHTQKQESSACIESRHDLRDWYFWFSG